MSASAYCPVCGRLPSESHREKVHQIHRMLQVDPVWVRDKTTGQIVPSKQRREVQRV